VDRIDAALIRNLGKHAIIVEEGLKCILIPWSVWMISFLFGLKPDCCLTTLLEGWSILWAPAKNCLQVRLS
jgi:hypothetical protein